MSWRPSSSSRARPSSPARSFTSTVASKGPFLWLVEGRTPLYLFGTIHVPDDRVLALPPSVMKAFGDYQQDPDVTAIVALDSRGDVLGLHGRPPVPVAALFEGEAGAVRLTGPSGKTSQAKFD